MKGVILAGGLGSRLLPLTKVTNKHLLPVYDRPMVLYPLETLRNSGIKDILIVCGSEYSGDFMRLLGTGTEFGVRLSYAIQETPNGGIADALRYARDFAADGAIAVILGDNIFDTDFRTEVKHFKRGAHIFLKDVPDARRFGVPVFDAGGAIERIEEKPSKPKSIYALTGFYLFDSSVFAHIDTLKPSARGEYEITDVINRYLKLGTLSHSFVQGAWYDAGTIESLSNVSSHMAKRHRARGAKSRHEEILPDRPRALILGRGYIGSLYQQSRHFDTFHSASDIRDTEAIQDEIRRMKPDIVINCAGKTNLEWCRDNKRDALIINAIAPRDVQKLCLEYGVTFVHIGSGCIFEGDNKGRGFSEKDEPSPRCYYAETKVIADELLLQEDTARTIILRPRQPFSGAAHPRNLLTKVISYDRLLTSQNSMTFVPDLVAATRHLLRSKRAGVFHVCNEGTLSPMDMARRAGKRLGLKKKWIPISKEDLDEMDKAAGREKRVDTIINSNKLASTGFVIPRLSDRISFSLRTYHET